jgi:glucose/arabinose dehydrogenase
VSLSLELVAELGGEITDIIPAPASETGDAGELWVAMRDGRVLDVPDSGPPGHVGTGEVVDLSSLVSSGETVDGLLGIALSTSGRYLFADYTTPDGHLRVDRLALGDGLAEPATRRESIIDLDHPYVHKGGDLVTLPNGDLLVSIASAAVTPENGTPENGTPENGRAQNGSAQNGSAQNGADEAQRPDGVVIRLIESVVESSTSPGLTAVPPESILARGFRNPWRIAQGSGERLLVWDVGESRSEELNLVSLAGPPMNFGWPYREGEDDFLGGAPFNPGDLAGPAYSYDHGDSACAVVGGLAYGGSKLGLPAGSAVFGDYCSVELRSLDMALEGTGEAAVLTELPAPPTVVAADRDGEVLVATTEGQILRLGSGDIPGSSEVPDSGGEPKGPSASSVEPPSPTTAAVASEPAPPAEFCSFSITLDELAGLRSLDPEEFESLANRLVATYQTAVEADALPEEPRADYSQLGPLFDRLAELGGQNEWAVSSQPVDRLVKLVQAERGEFSTALRAQILLLGRGGACP